jgi:hypothetical protein
MKGEQFKQLPVTTSSYVVDDKGTEAYFLFIVLFVGVVFNQILSLVPNDFISNNCFPFAVAFTFLVYFVFKRYLNGKPTKFVLHLLQYFTIPKKYTHQYREPESIFADE